jgi:DNA-directed RNA polymerase II subunit RPB2
MAGQEESPSYLNVHKEDSPESVKTEFYNPNDQSPGGYIERPIEIIPGVTPPQGMTPQTPTYASTTPTYGGPVTPTYGEAVTPTYGGPVSPTYGGPVTPQYAPMTPPEPTSPPYGGPVTPQYAPMTPPEPTSPPYGGPMTPPEPTSPPYGGPMTPPEPTSPPYGGPMTPPEPTSPPYGGPMTPPEPNKSLENVKEIPFDAYEQPISAKQAREIAMDLIHSYFTTHQNPLVKHHIDSYDQFLSIDLKNIIASQNPILILNNPKAVRESGSDIKSYKYKTEIYIGGESGSEIFIGTPMVSLNQGEDVRLLFPNEARLRNLTYAIQVQANIFVRVTIKDQPQEDKTVQDSVHEIMIEKYHLFNIPLMLHSSYCMLHAKPATLLTQMGECPMDQGGYFIIEGSEKTLITQQEGAFNTLWIKEQPKDEQAQFYGSISCLNPVSREIKSVYFYWTREAMRSGAGFSKGSIYKQSVLEVNIPYCLKPIPVFVLFRAMGIQSDKDILQMIFPDLNSPESKLLADMLLPSINAAAPFLDTYSAIQYIKSLTKGFSEFHVLDILHNHLFTHVEDLPEARVNFLADCVRQMLRVVRGLDTPHSRDDTKYQRLLTSGFLCQMLFQNIYKTFIKTMRLNVDELYNYNESIYSNMDYLKIFGEANQRKVFSSKYITDGIMRGFKGKWTVGPDVDKAGVLQEMSRLSYLDFMSHMRRVVLNFDSSMKLKGPRFLDPSQYGYFCTSETPSGSHIGITKNLSIMTAISTNAPIRKFLEWLLTRGQSISCGSITPELAAVTVPIYLNSGIVGFTAYPKELVRVLKFMKHSGYMPPLSSCGFNIPERRIFIFMDDGRPLRPLIMCKEQGKLPDATVFNRKTWREYVVGTLREDIPINSREFVDPLADTKDKQVILKDYVEFFEKNLDKLALIEYLDPFEQNEALLANYPEHVGKETTHMEVHPSTILGLLGNMIPFPNHNQSPRNQLSASQSKQGLSLYATNWKNRFDNTANILCYGQAPLSRTIYQDYIGDGKMPYGQNVILAMGMYGGYNQEDGIIMNADALARGQFRSINYRSYEAFEEDDSMTKTITRIANPKNIPAWLNLKASIDYSKLDDNGIVKEGSYVDQNTAIVGRYMMTQEGQYSDATVTPQVWTSGRVEKVAITVNNMGLKLIKIRVSQDRVPELGDKFCLSADHEVCTIEGWKPIADVTVNDQVLQYFPGLSVTAYVNPTETMVFDHTGEMYEIVTNNGSQYVTPEHKVYCKKTGEEPYGFLEAKDLYALNDGSYLMLSDTFQELSITNIVYNATNQQGDTVYCITVPTSIFLIRRTQSTPEQEPYISLWTGNSNRHGQKGTINILYRGHDMPRTADGIVPDMIMNPTAIPSRMTIGQILEMILGNVAAHVGAIGNCTAFMNDGSPHPELGKILEQLGLNKMCNQVLYNGMTGEQMTADIFMGVVYGMRLKHMTVDKWNARGFGRREQRTHQPTGGRGNEGGLKIGEMERDAIAAHGIATFTQESFMKRSDGSQIYVCNGCGTIPIYNEKQNFFLCTTCDGPIKYAGDTANSLEPIPPPIRSGVTFSKVDIPYSTKLFFQEMETFMNMGFRILTTRDVTKLKGLDKIEDEIKVDLDGIAQPLPTMVYPETVLPELQQVTPAPTVEEIQRQIDNLNAKAQEEYQTEQQANAQIIQKANEVLLQDVKTFPVVSFQTNQPNQQNQQNQPNQPNQQNQQNQQNQHQMVQPIQSNIRVPVPVTSEGTIVATTEKGEPIIAVDTSEQVLKENGLVQPRDSTASLEPPMMQQPQYTTMRRIRRQPSRPQQGGYGFYGQQPFFGQAPQVMRENSTQPQGEEEQSSKSNSQVRVTVEKLG